MRLAAIASAATVRRTRPRVELVGAPVESHATQGRLGRKGGSIWASSLIGAILLAFGPAAPASAAVVYELTSEDLSLQFTLPVLAQYTTSVSGSGFDRCSTPSISCVQFTFAPDSNYAVLNYLDNGQGPYKSFIYTFSFGDLSKLGSHATISGPPATMLIQATDAVPEPSAWALMLLGFGGSGAALRRRRAALA